jgi:hypothetical protein
MKISLKGLWSSFVKVRLCSESSLDPGLLENRPLPAGKAENGCNRCAKWRSLARGAVFRQGNFFTLLLKRYYSTA